MNNDLNTPSSNALQGVNVAILIANGFQQDDFVEAQKSLLAQGANVRVVSSESGLVNGWSGDTWGHHFAVDKSLNTALAADYDMLVMPGGQRNVDKLKLTAHSKRFVNSFLMAEKPVAMMDDSILLLAYTDCMAGRKVAGPETSRSAVEQAGGVMAGQDMCVDGSLMTCAMDSDEARQMFIQSMMETFVSAMEKTTMQKMQSQAA